MTIYIGLMSGTSLDGVDGALVRFADGTADALQVLAHAHRPFPAPLRAELLALNGSGADELHRSALAANGLARVCVDVVQALLEHGAAPRRSVRAIGVHGQTVRHRPREFDGVGYTLQLNAPAYLAELTGIDVVADFRSRDVAAGGIGAPLVPAFHRAVFGRPDAAVGVLNLGGISNLTVLHADGRTTGFDCGPANALMDHWSELHTGQAFDADGAWAASGRVCEPLLAALLAEPFFSAAPPKSTGRDRFNPGWLSDRLQPFASTGLEPRDVQATLAELTARTCTDAFRRHAGDAARLLVCGGGALNCELMRRLTATLPGVVVESTEASGLPPLQVEACAFAWLARAFVERRPGNLPAVTGARGPRVLGALYPAGAPVGG
jgi:anhydro-N-acetylmuramic acid kinase